MRELDAHAAAATDLEVLLDRGEEIVPLVADVARVEAIVLAHDLGEGRDLVDGAVRARRVDQPGGEPDRALVERAREQRPHRRELATRRRSVVAAHHALAEGAVTDERAEVDRASRSFDCFGVLAERGPRPLEAVTRDLAVELLGREAHHRGGRAAAVPRDDARDSLME